MKVPVKYLPPSYMFAKGNADIVYNALLNELDWFHARELVPRKEYYVHQKGLPYKYGKGDFAREYASDPDHWAIDVVRKKLFDHFATFEFDVVFLNLYEDQHKHLGWHADNSPEMSDDHPIVTVSLGAERDIMFRENGSSEVERLRLEHGSAAIMLPGMQDTHQHRIPKHDRPCGPRISLTFRKFVYA